MTIKASAKRVTKTITRTVEETVDVVELQLTPHQAETLLLVTRSIGGDAGRTRRGDMDAIGDALRAAGVNHPLASTMSGSIYF